MLRRRWSRPRSVTDAARDGDLTQRIPMEGKSGPIGDCAPASTR
jgi:hypothetical protein